MVEGTRRPGRGRAMTGIALSSCLDMRDRFGLGVLRNEPAAMAGNALARHAGMIHRRGRPIKETIHMTGIARSGGGDVGCRLGQCICKGVGAIMASSTLPFSSTMIHLGGLESHFVRMAHITLSRCRHVSGRLAEGDGAVVTSRAATGYGRNDVRRIVVERRRCPRGSRSMASIALRTGWYMTGRLRLGVLRKERSVVTGGAIACCRRAAHVAMHCRDANGNGGPLDTGGVAGIAGSGSWNMSGRLASCPCAVVTGRALASISKRMRIAGPHPTRCRVAGIAGLGGLRVDRRFASCPLAYECAVVAGGAGTLGSPLRRKVAKCAGGKSDSRMACAALGCPKGNML